MVQRHNTAQLDHRQNNAKKSGTEYTPENTYLQDELGPAGRPRWLCLNSAGNGHIKKPKPFPCPPVARKAPRELTWGLPVGFGGQVSWQTWNPRVLRTDHTLVSSIRPRGPFCARSHQPLSSINFLIQACLEAVFCGFGPGWVHSLSFL